MIASMHVLSAPERLMQDWRSKMGERNRQMGVIKSDPDAAVPACLTRIIAIFLATETVLPSSFSGV
jgi:hypothetical protein